MANAIKHPICYIVAGPNGAGKTTFSLKYLPEIARCDNFINADEIARGISPLNIEAGQLPASKIFLQTLKEKLKQRKTFAFETTLSGRTYAARIPRWQESGWKVILIYLYIPSADFSAMRVRQRVEQGGHDIPVEDIIRRYPRSIRNLFLYAEICDQTFCFDNKRGRVNPIFEKAKGKPAEIINYETYSKILETIGHE